MVSKASKFGRDQLVEFRWELAVGDDTLTEDEIAALAETKAPLIRLRGQWVAVDPEQLRRGLEFLERKPTGRKTAAEILALAASHPDDIDTPLRGHRCARRRVARGPARRGRRTVAAAAGTAGRIHRDAASLPAARPVVAGVPVLAGLG